MHRHALTAAILALSTPALAAPDLTGTWVTDDGQAAVRIAPCGEALCGTISDILVPTPEGPPVDENNPDPAQRNRPLVGTRILHGFTMDGDGWTGGRIYNPWDGRTYRSRLALADDGTLKVSGCWAVFCKTQRWTRRR